MLGSKALALGGCWVVLQGERVSSSHGPQFLQSPSSLGQILGRDLSRSRRQRWRASLHERERLQGFLSQLDYGVCCGGVFVLVWFFFPIVFKQRCLPPGWCHPQLTDHAAEALHLH